jgi:tetratricopeptide (TPR) repeat protein
LFPSIKIPVNELPEKSMSSTIEELRFLLQVKNDYTCPISHQIMNDPVVVQSGHTFEREAIEKWLQGHPKKQTCPITRKVLSSTILIENHFLRSLIHRFKARIIKFALDHFEEMMQQQHYKEVKQVVKLASCFDSKNLQILSNLTKVYFITQAHNKLPRVLFSVIIILQKEATCEDKLKDILTQAVDIDNMLVITRTCEEIESTENYSALLSFASALEALDRKEQAAIPYVKASRILLQKQQITEAVSLMTHAIDLDPSNSSLFEEMKGLLIKNNNAEQVALVMQHKLDVELKREELMQNNIQLLQETVQHYMKELGEYQVSSKRKLEEISGKHSQEVECLRKRIKIMEAEHRFSAPTI